jgi:hypothetical protein
MVNVLIAVEAEVRAPTLWHKSSNNVNAAVLVLADSEKECCCVIKLS